MKTPRSLLAGILLGTMLGTTATAAAAERNPRGLALHLAKKLEARRQAPPQTHATDFAGTDIGCIILPRFELRPYGYPGHGFLCEVNATGEVLGALVNKRGRPIRGCDIVGFYAGDLCYDFTICGNAETLCVQ